MFTVTMSLGSMELGKHGVLVTRLSAIEDAASMSVLCADKTGTITKNQLTVVDIFSSPPNTDNDVIMIASLCSKEANADAIDLAILEVAKQKSILQNIQQRGYKEKVFMPFSPKSRRTQSVIESSDGKEFTVTKGN